VSFRLLRAIVAKDVRCLFPLVVFTAVLFFGDALIVRLDLLPIWSTWGAAVLLVAFIVMIFAVFQLDSPASLTEDWLCRPLRKREMLGAKIALVLLTVYVPHAVGTLIADLSLGFPVPEVLLDALLLPDELFLLLLPVMMLVAISTRTFVQAFGVLIAIFICVAVLPTPFMRDPQPHTLGLDELLQSGMVWLATAPARIVSLVLVVLGFWLVYWRRNLTAARVLLALIVVATYLLFLVPMKVLPWKTTFEVQAAAGPTPPADAQRIHLRSSRACFPAAMRANQSTDVAFAAAKGGLKPWNEEGLVNAGANSIAFLTAVEVRGLPLDWRVKLAYVQANYSAARAPVESLRPATFITDGNGGGTLDHYWMLPESTLQTLRGRQPQLELSYSLALLKPRDHNLPTDGKRHALSGLGWCSAKVDPAASRIEVDCFTAITHPTQISAQLNDIPASRVFDSPNFAPEWAQQPYSHRAELAIGSIRLAKHDTITVTAWESAGYITKTLSTPGILGGDAETCPLPASDGSSFQQARWRDAAPHEPSSVTVDDGVQLEVLDFGGTGSPILLLPGLGATAHSFDEFAPMLARHHRVIAMTRRGTGASSKPDFGFDTPTLARDVLRVMDAMKLEKVLLAGHSIAGDELTWLGGHHPERFNGLVYLDAAYDRSRDRNDPALVRMRELGRFLPPEPPMPRTALESFDAMSKLIFDRGHVPLPEGELIAFHHMNNPYLAGTPNIDGRTQQAISAAIQAPDYAAVKIPALAIFAFADPDEPLPPWYDAHNQELLASLAERARIANDIKRSSIDLFRRDMKKGQVLELRNAEHYIFQSNTQEVLDAVEKFAAGDLSGS
jgi:pimeloyl-ACP methyl ester carboxylesterase